MGKLLKLTTNGLHRPNDLVDKIDDIDFDSVASLLMDEIFTDFTLLLHAKLVRNKIVPTRSAMEKFCESINELMGDMNVDEILKEVKR